MCGQTGTSTADFSIAADTYSRKGNLKGKIFSIDSLPLLNYHIIPAILIF